MPDFGKAYFKPLIKNKKLSFTFKNAIKRAKRDLLLKNPDLILPDYYGYINGTVYPDLMDRFVELEEWEDRLANDLVQGFMPYYGFKKVISDPYDTTVYSSYFEENDNTEFKLLFLEAFRVDGLTCFIVSDLEYILNFYIGNNIDKKLICGEFNKSISELNEESCKQDFSLICNPRNRDDFYKTPEYYLSTLRQLKTFDQPLWLNKVIENNTERLNMKPKKNHNHSDKVQNQLYVLIGWLTAKELIGENLRNHRLNREIVFSEIVKIAPDIFDHPKDSESAEKSAYKKLFSVAREQGYCRFSDK